MDMDEDELYEIFSAPVPNQIPTPDKDREAMNGIVDIERRLRNLRNMLEEIRDCFEEGNAERGKIGLGFLDYDIGRLGEYVTGLKEYLKRI